MNKAKVQKLRARRRQAESAQVSSPKPIKIILGIMVISILTLATWFGWNAWQGGSGTDTQSGVPGHNVPLLDTVGTSLGEIAPDFSVPTLDGGTYTLAEQRGKPTIIFFMAYWCGTCVPEGQALAQLKQEYGENLSIVAVDVDPSSTPEGLARFKEMADNGEFAWAFGTGQQVTAAYEVATLDTTLILDREGHVIYRDQWPSTYQSLKDELVKLGL